MSKYTGPGDSGRSNSGALRGMPGVNMRLNDGAGEGTAKVHHDAPLGTQGLVMLVQCCTPREDCTDTHGQRGKATCGCYRIDGKALGPERARELATEAGWMPVAPGKWVCPGCQEYYALHPELFNEMAQHVGLQSRLAAIKKEGGLVLG